MATNTIRLGKIGLCDKGAYDGSATYARLDFVTDGFSTYFSRKDGNTGNALPTDGQSTEWWGYLANADSAKTAAADAAAATEELKELEEAVNAAETTRQENEEKRVAGETARQAAETKREEAEAARGEAYTAAEKQRDADYADAEAARDALYKEAEAARDTKYSDAEAARDTTFEAAEAARETNETARKSAESARAEAETQRASAETARAEAETSRANAETARAEAETKRVSAESARVEEENSRESAESARAEAETARATAESERAEAETERANAETARAEAESTRVKAESERATAETARESAEAARVNAESARATTETARAEAEEARATAEEARKTAEDERAAAETLRTEAETAREEASKTAVSNANAAADTANAATTKCEAATADAQEATQELSGLVPYIQQLCAYGVEFDTTVSAPECTRIGSSDLHKSLPVQGAMRGCLLADDGTVNSYLDGDDWTGAVRDGSEGQVMVEIPRHWRKFVSSGTKRQVWLSTMALDGFTEVPKMYVSAYEATLDRTNLKLASVVNETEQYRGGSNNADYDGTYRTFLGRPATAISRTNFRKYARARNTDTTQWNCMTYDIQKSLYWLFVVEYATLNSQAAYNSELTTDGYRQGGLGAGVTTFSGTNWSSYNGNYPFVPCGQTDTIGNGTGCVDYAVDNGDEDNPIAQTFSVPRYRGVENPFGHIWQWTDGINVRISPTEDNGGDGLSKVYVCSDPSKYTDTGYGGYTYVGDEARDGGWVKEIIFGEGGEIMPAAVGGGSTTYFCDYHYTNIPTTEALRGLLFGGDAHYGAYAGFAYALSYYAPSNSYSNVGSRLCFIP